jgi:hypothetical protein
MKKKILFSLGLCIGICVCGYSVNTNAKELDYLVDSVVQDDDIYTYETGDGYIRYLSKYYIDGIGDSRTDIGYSPVSVKISLDNFLYNISFRVVDSANSSEYITEYKSILTNIKNSSDLEQYLNNLLYSDIISVYTCTKIDNVKERENISPGTSENVIIE